MRRLFFIAVMLLLSAVSPLIDTSYIEAKNAPATVSGWHTDPDMFLLDYISVRCKQEDIPVSVVHKMIERESQWNFRKKGELVGKTRTVNPEGSYGLMQIKLGTAWDVMGDTTITQEQLIVDNILNAECGIRYVSMLRNYYNGSLTLAVTAFNRGPGKVNSDINRGKKPYNKYTTVVMNTLKKTSTKTKK